VPPRLLIVTNQFDPHADHVISQLRRRGIDFFRLNTEEYPQGCVLSLSFPASSYIISLKTRQLDCSSVAAVWYRKPDPFDLHPEVQDLHHQRFAAQQCQAAMSGLWQVLDTVSWINHPSALAKAERKVLQLHLARRLGFLLPRTIITNDPGEARNFLRNLGSGRNGIAKTLGYAAGYSVMTTVVSPDDDRALDAIKYAPVILQEYVPKKVEIRVHVIGKKVLAAEIHSQRSEKTAIDWRNYDFDNVPHWPHPLPSKLEVLCVELVRSLGLEFGVIDLILTPNDDYVFLELNPNGQWLWIETLVGLPIAETLVDLMEQKLKW